MSDVQEVQKRKGVKYPRRSFGHLKNDALEALGASAGGSAMMAVAIIMSLMIALIFVNFHAIYIKTGTPMLGYGLAFSFLQPFYTLWAIWVVLSKYLLGN